MANRYSVDDSEFKEAYDSEDIPEDVFDGELEDDNAKKVLKAVERILEDTDKIIDRTDRFKRLAKRELTRRDQNAGEKALFKATAKRVISYYSNLSSFGGAVSGIPAIVPGIGSLLSFVGASFVDVVLTLKFEVEMTLALCHLAGFDIHEMRDRRLAFTLASISSYDVQATESIFSDSAALGAAAFWDYSSRQLGKYLLMSISRRIMLSTGKAAAKALPLVGVAIGLGVNKALTSKTGHHCIEPLWLRRKIRPETPKEEVIEARFDDSGKVGE